MPLSLIPPSDPILWTPAAKVNDVAAQVLPYLEEAKKLMVQSGGVGLAAPQFGHSYAWCLVAMRGLIWTLINPVILETSGFNVSKVEGCLSFPGKTTFVKRPDIVKVEWVDEHGVEMGSVFCKDEARVIQHEVQHLSGITIWPRPANMPPLPEQSAQQTATPTEGRTSNES